MNLTPTYSLQDVVFVVIDGCIYEVTIYWITATGTPTSVLYEYDVYTPNTVTNVTRYRQVDESVVFATDADARNYLMNQATVKPVSNYLPD